jgi:hypothetical protein
MPSRCRGPGDDGGKPGTAIDPDCFAALKAGIEDFSLYLAPEQPLARAS